MLKSIVYLLNGVTILLWVVGICQVEIKKEKVRWLIWGISFSGILIISLFCKNEIEKLFISIVLIIIGYWSIIQESWDKKIVILLFSVFYEMIIAFPIKVLTAIIEIFWKSQHIYVEIIQGILEICCIVAVSYALRKKKSWIKWIKNLPSKYYLFGFICAFSASGITSYIEMQIKNTNSEIRLVVMLLTAMVNVFFYVAGIGIAIIDLLKEHYREENILKDEYLHLSKQHYESLLENIKEVRSLKHDIKAHLNAVAHFVEKREWDNLNRYIETAKGVVDKNMKRYVNVNHDLVNAILTEGIAGKEDIKVIYEGAIPNNILIEDFDLCTIFSNLISNGVEACQQVVNLEKEIILQIKRFQKNLCIYMENSVEEIIDVHELGKNTRKKDKKNHGYGIFNIIKTVEKYEGEVNFQCKNNRFSVEIIFFNIIK